MALCGAAHIFCDIIGELAERHIYDVSDQILLFLDYDDLKNVCLVSKAWRGAILVTCKALVKTGSPFFSGEQLALWQKVRLHLEHGFHIPAEDPLYHLRLFNSIKLGFEHLSNENWPSPDVMTLNYMPFDFSACPEFYPRCRFEMSEKFIVAWDPASGKLNYWSRRSLSLLNMPSGFDSVPYPTEVGNVGTNFRLSGSNLVMGYRTGKVNDCVDGHVVISLDLDSQCTGGIPKIETVMLPFNVMTKLPSEDDDVGCTFIHQLAIEGPLLMIVFTVCRVDNFNGPQESSTITKFAAVLSELGLIQERLLADDSSPEDFVWFQNSLEIPSLAVRFDDNYYRFLDKDCAVFHWSHDPESRGFGFRTFSLHPPQGGGSVELRLVAEFEVNDAVIIQYARGLLASGSTKGEITLVDVKTGLVRCVFLAHTSFSYKGTLFRMSQDHLVVSWTGIEFIDPGMTFKVWDLHTILDSPYDCNVQPPSLKPICMLQTMSGKLVDFKMDKFGIVAVMEKDKAGMGIQVLNFLPLCNSCKRTMAPALMKRCSRCKSATYCGKECQKVDWNPHHKAICSQLDEKGILKGTENVVIRQNDHFVIAQHFSPYFLEKLLKSLRK